MFRFGNSIFEPLWNRKYIDHVQIDAAESIGVEKRGRFYDSTGNTLDYVYELDGDTLTIWGGAKGSPAYYRGTFSPDGTAVTGEWTYPGGGGYRSTMTRI